MLMTLCYMKKDDKYLMLHRTKKKHDVNSGKWIGVGGKLESNELPEEGIKREIMEETGYIPKSLDYRGIVVFNYNDNPPEYMFLYTCEDFSGDMVEGEDGYLQKISNDELLYCDEGDLKWIDSDKIFDLELWEGDKIFLELLLKDEKRFFYLTLNYCDDDLIDYNIYFKDDGFVRFEVFVPEEYVEKIVKNLSKYDLLREGFYSDVYAKIQVEGHWTTLEGANPFDGDIGKHSSEKETLMKFRVKSEFEELAYYLVKEAHPYEVPVINVYR